MNVNVLNSLPNALRQAGIPAKLRINSTGDVISFLYNPESLGYSREASYAEAVTGGTGISEQNYIRTAGRTLTIPNLLLDSYAAGKSLSQLIEGLEKLLLPSGIGLAPETVSFQWGTKLLSPAVITSISWEETAWLSGEPAQARLNLTLLQIPEAPSPTDLTAAPTGGINLTDRQREDARKKAGEWLTVNASKLRPDVRAAFNSKRFRYLTDTSGNVSITNEAGNSFGRVGTWDGAVFAPLGELTI
jgi:Contractile injection system tube protein